MKELKFIHFSTFLLTTLLIGTLFITSCDNLLDSQPLDQTSEDNVWNDVNLTSAFLNDIYLGLEHGANQAQLGGMTDNGANVTYQGTLEVVQSTVTASSMGNLLSARRDHYKWEHNYDFIRKANIFLSEIDDASIENVLKNRMKGEVHYLRAHFYHNLLRTHGGVPIITRAYELGDNNMQIPRNSFAETVDFIVQEAENAADLLPLVQEGANLGRATKGAALALKARVLLFAASDLYHVNPSGMAETGYIDVQDRIQMWRDAKNASKAVMDLDQYSLFHANPAPGDSIARNYYEIFHTPNHEEKIMVRYFARRNPGNYRPGQVHGPNGYGSWGGITPIQQFVDSYRMRDGSKFNWNDPQHAAEPYKNRDPRFYGTVLYDGAKFRERPSALQEIDPVGIIQTFLSLELPDGSTFPGLDTRLGPMIAAGGTRSGYYLRKLGKDHLDPATSQAVPGFWIFIRYAEILLNYTEASIELGEYNDARRELNKIRIRAGMPEFDSSLTGQMLKEEYRNERRIEMAYEEQRFFDVRRWMIAPEVMNEDALSILINVKGADRTDRSTYFDYKYEIMPFQERSWDDKMYFFPIIQEEINSNDQLVQNPGF